LHDGEFLKTDCKGRANDSKKKDNSGRMCARRENTAVLATFPFECFIQTRMEWLLFLTFIFLAVETIHR